MKQSLDLKLGQHLTITPQLQQAIRLLQLSSLELQQEIQEALENNPLLEELEEEAAIREPSEAPVEEAVTADSAGDDHEASEVQASEEQAVDRDAAIEDDSLRDELTGSNDDWEDNSESLSASATRNEGGDGLPDIDARNSAPTTLREHLLWQMQMAISTPRGQPRNLAKNLHHRPAQATLRQVPRPRPFRRETARRRLTKSQI